MLLPAELPPGAATEATLDFHLELPRRPGRLSFTDRAVALGNWLPLLTVHRGEWDRRPYVDVGDAFFSAIADFDLTLSASGPAVLAHGGVELESGPTTWRVRAARARDLGLALATDYATATAAAGPVPVVAYTLAPERAEWYAQTGAAMLQWFADRFGSYPYPRLAIAEVDLPASYAGMEYPGLVLLAGGLPFAPDRPGSDAEYILAHEIAHQWFYALVGNDQIADPWLDEALATYLPLLYFRDQDPARFEPLYARHVSDGLAARLAAAGHRPVSSGIAGFASDGPYYAVVYRQGAAFLRDLHQALGEAEFFALLGEYVQTFRDKLATPRALLDLAQRHAGQNLSPLFAAYFGYGAFTYPEPRRWTLQTPASPWSGPVQLGVAAEFPIAAVEFWLDDRRLPSGPDGTATVDASALAPGEYLLLARIFDDQGALYERAERVRVGG